MSTIKCAGTPVVMNNTQDVTACHTAVEFRVLGSAEELSQVSALERAVWRYDDVDLIPVTMLVATIKCGALVLGAFDEDRMVGFAYSMPGRRLGRWIHWSHMLGVSPAHRGVGLGYRLKMEQRRLVSEGGFAEIHWTFDPLQVANAHLNLNKLGAVAAEFVENAYGESTSPLHRGTPTDRLIVHWPATREPVVPRPEDAGDLHDVPVVNPVYIEGGWPTCHDVADRPLGADRLLVCVPDDFSRMLLEAPERALRWRLATRPLFARILVAGYRGVQLVRWPDVRAGAYLFVRGT
ncbi:MAG: GNAT family N-acetyltransferase [Luteitalea sp.]|nr:GNAT family N-acetyltransferase [Luteitalea sp.]